MRIVIAGAGEVGSHLATMLGEGAHEITVIDSDPKLLENVTNISDVVAVEGDCTTFAVLKRAAVRKAEETYRALCDELGLDICAYTVGADLLNGDGEAAVEALYREIGKTFQGFYPWQMYVLTSHP